MTSFLINPYRFGGAWTPANITTALWLDASDASTVTTVSGAVSQWNDKSGNGRNVTQSTATKRPSYVSAGLNSLNICRFDGTDDELLNTAVGLPVGASARSAFAVYKPNRTTSINSVFGQGSPTSGQMFAIQFRVTGATGDPYFAGFAQDLTDSVAPTTAAKQAAIVFTGTAGSLYRDGSLTASGALTLNTTQNQLLVGNSPTAVEYAQMDLAEIIYTANAASTTTRQLIEGYLAHKWGLAGSLPTGHPYKSAAPTV